MTHNCKNVNSRLTTSLDNYIIGVWVLWEQPQFVGLWIVAVYCPLLR